VEVQPGGVTSRIRGLQTHKQKIELATPGSRVAVNLTGLSKSELARGQVVTTPGWLIPTVLVDVQYHHLEQLEKPLRHNREVKFFSGSAEVLARTRVLGQESIPPGENGWLQLRLDQPVALAKGDRFILRLPSPGKTLGGGAVVDPAPRRRHRRFRSDVVDRLETLAQGTPSEILLQAFETRGPLSAGEAAKQSGLTAKEVKSLLAEMTQSGQVVPLGSEGPAQLLMARSRWTALLATARAQLTDYHQASPLKPGMMREELKSRLGLNPKEFNGFMGRAAQEGQLVDEGVYVRLPGHEIRFTPEQETAITRLLRRFHKDPYNTPSTKECISAVGEDVLLVLIGRDELVQVSPDVLFLAGTIGQAEDRVRRYVAEKGSITVGEARDLFRSSRKYVLSLLEYLDQQGVTRREGDTRVIVD
jgi:selenocysteine-specific elongation factor